MMERGQDPVDGRANGARRINPSAQASWGALPLSDGSVLRFRTLGAGPPLLLLHGFGCDGAMLLDLGRRLAPRFRVLIPDQRGHGRSADCPVPEADEAGAPSAMQRLADDALRLIDAQADGPAVALGWSMGAAVLFQAIAQGGADRLAGLCVEDMAPRVAAAPDWSLGLVGAGPPPEAAAAADAMAADWPRMVDRMAPRIFASGPGGVSGSAPPDALASDLRASMRRSAPAAMAPLWRALVAADYRATVAGLKIPVMLARGGRSRLYPAGTMDWMAARLRAARVRVYPAAGHAPHLEAPERFAADFAAFAAACVDGR